MKRARLGISFTGIFRNTGLRLDRVVAGHQRPPRAERNYDYRRHRFSENQDRQKSLPYRRGRASAYGIHGSADGLICE